MKHGNVGSFAATALVLLVLALTASGCGSASRKIGYDEQVEKGKEAYHDRNWEEAIAAYREAVRLQPRAPQAHNDLGAVLYDVGRVEEAIDEYETALRFDPDYAEAHNNLGVALLSQGRTAESVAAYRRALSLRPEFTEARYNLCLGLELLGALAEALEQCRQVAADDPAQPGVAAAALRLQRKLAESR